MTQIRVISNGDRYLRMSCNGHADTEAVCAGISAICYSLSGWCENNRHHLKFLSHTENSGNYTILIEGDECANSAFEMAVIGLLQIQKAHPKEVEMTVK